jgi:hypothetical protein
MATNGTKSYPLFRDLAELALTSASEPQINLHFPMFRHAGSRVSTRKHKQRSEVAVVVKTYDMRGRIGLIEDEMRQAVEAFAAGDKDKLRGCLRAARLHADAAIVAVDTEMPTQPQKPASGRL